MFGFGRKKDRVTPGSYYSVRQSAGFHISKVLVVDADGVHLRVYSGRHLERPKRIDVESLVLGRFDTPDPGIGHIPLTRRAFEAMAPEFIQVGTIQADELDGYEIWKSDSGSYFG